MSGPLNHSPADVTRQLLIGLGQGITLSQAGSGQWAISADGEPDRPDSVITLFDTTGVDDGRTQDGELQEFHGIQVRVRAPDFPTAWAKARSIAVAFDGVKFANVIMGTLPNQSTYKVYSITRTSGPISLGKPGPTKRSVLTLNATVCLRMTASP